MRRSRIIAGTPCRSATEAWATVVALIGDSIERSNDVPDGSCAKALRPLDGLMAAMISSGSFDDRPIVVTAGPFQVAVTIATGDAAFTVEENLAPVPGGASAVAAWKMYIPARGSLGAALEAAAAALDHVSTGTAPEPSEKASTGSSAIDAAALRALGGR
ncbi:hypothetical protein ITJ68_18215 [Curtobacterium sp. VKM Ac-1395]|nr:hypothetical protein [Curtobacterium sp. VKM Ac-1395]